jgi:hypothetical protein
MTMAAETDLKKIAARSEQDKLLRQKYQHRSPGEADRQIREHARLARQSSVKPPGKPAS